MSHRITQRRFATPKIQIRTSMPGGAQPIAAAPYTEKSPLQNPVAPNPAVDILLQASQKDTAGSPKIGANPMYGQKGLDGQHWQAGSKVVARTGDDDHLHTEQPPDGAHAGAQGPNNVRCP